MIEESVSISKDQRQIRTVSLSRKAQKSLQTHIAEIREEHPEEDLRVSEAVLKIIEKSRKYQDRKFKLRE